MLFLHLVELKMLKGDMLFDIRTWKWKFGIDGFADVIILCQAKLHMRNKGKCFCKVLDELYCYLLLLAVANFISHLPKKKKLQNFSLHIKKKKLTGVTRVTRMDYYPVHTVICQWIHCSVSANNCIVFLRVAGTGCQIPLVK